MCVICSGVGLKADLNCFGTNYIERIRRNMTFELRRWPDESYGTSQAQEVMGKH